MLIDILSLMLYCHLETVYSLLSDLGYFHLLEIYWVLEEEDEKDGG